MERRSVLSRSVIVIAVLIGIFVLFSLRRWNIDHPRPTPRTVEIPNAIRQKFAELPHKPELIATAEHGSSIKVVAFSPVDASLVASSSVVGRAARTIKLWNLNDTDKPVEILGGNTFAFSPDGRFLAITSGQRGARLWHIDEKKSVSTFGLSSYVIAFSPDGQWIANDSLGVKLWDARTPTAVTAGATLSRGGRAEKLAFSPDGKLLATEHLIGGDVTIWDIESQQAIKTLKQDAKSTRALKFSPDMKNLFLAIADDNSNIELYAFPDWHRHATITKAPVRDLAFTPDGRILVSGGFGGIAFWSLETGKRIAAIEDSSNWVNSVAFSADGTALASGWSDGVLRVWDTSQYMNPQESVSQDIVRLIYFLPSDRAPQPDITEKLDKLIKEAQQFYADQMEQHGLGKKTFTFEKNEDGSAKVYLVEGQYADKYYLKNTVTRVENEVNERFDGSKNIHLIAVDISSEGIGNVTVAGAGGITPFGLDYEKDLWGARGGRAVIPASGGDGFNWEVLAHELGHAFGLKHDFRDPSYLMSYGRAEKRLSECSAQWLDKSHYFNPGQPFFDEPLGIEIGLSSVNLSKSKVLQFHLKDVDGLHQAMLFTPPTVDTPLPGYQSSENAETNKKNWENTQKAKSSVLHDYQLLNAQKEATVEFSVPESVTNYIQISMIDVHGNITFRTFDLSEDIAELVE